MPMSSADAARQWRERSVAERDCAHRRKPVAASSRVRTQAQPPAHEAMPIDPEPPSSVPPVAPLPLPHVSSPGFDEAMMQREAALLDRARLALEEAADGGNAGAFNFALSSYAKLQDVFAKTRERWLETKRRRGEVLTCDEALAVVGPHMAEMRRALAKFGDRNAAKANPADPGHAKRVLDEAVDLALASLDAVAPSLTKAYRPKSEEEGEA